MNRIKRVLTWQPYERGSWQAVVTNFASFYVVYSLMFLMFGGDVGVWIAGTVTAIATLAIVLTVTARGRRS